MIIFITHGDGPRGAERAVRNLLTDAPSFSWLSVVSLGKAFGVKGDHLHERPVQGKAEAVSAVLAEIARGETAGQAVTLCYVNGHMAVPFTAFALARLRGFLGSLCHGAYNFALFLGHDFSPPSSLQSP